MKNLIITVLMLTSASAYPMAAWTPQNAPQKLDFDYKTKLSDLPESGKLTKRPWSGDYWATYKGGITYRWLLPTDNETQKIGYSLSNMDNLTERQIITMSPAEKYDLFMGYDSYPLTNLERERTNVLATLKGLPSYDPSVEIQEWEGLCHAWAPATLAYENPKPIFVEGANGHIIPFGSSDIKALLTYHFHLNSKEKTTKFLGSRCNLDFKPFLKKYSEGQISFDELNQNIDRLRIENANRYNKEACMDTNAGSFHVVLTNQIALKDEGFIIDRTRDLEVWNQPVYSYTTKIISESEGASANAAPGTVKEVTVETTVIYIGEVQARWYNNMAKQALQKITYKYVLELNIKGQIIGGEWISYDRPDFIYKEETPKFTGFFKGLENLYKRATSPKNPKALKNALKKIKKVSSKNFLTKKFIKTVKVELNKKKVLAIGKKEGRKHVIKNRFLKESKKLVQARLELTQKLISAVRARKKKDIVKYIKMGAKVNPRVEEGVAKPEELINRVIHKKSPELLKLFIEKGASVKTVLIKAVKMENMKIFKTLLDAGADTNYYSEEFKTNPLLSAAHKGNLEMVKILLKKGAAKTINAKGVRGRTALMLAIRGLGDGTNRDRMKIVELLIKSGIDVKAVDAKEKDATWHANKKGNSYTRKIIKLIKKA